MNRQEGGGILGIMDILRELEGLILGICYVNYRQPHRYRGAY